MRRFLMRRFLVILGLCGLLANQAAAQSLRELPRFEATLVAKDTNPPLDSYGTSVRGRSYPFGFFVKNGVYNQGFPRKTPVTLTLKSDFGPEVTFTIRSRTAKPEDLCVVTIQHLGEAFGDDLNFTWKMKVAGAESAETLFTLKDMEITIPIKGGGWHCIATIKRKPRPASLTNAIPATHNNKKYWLVPNPKNPLIWYYLPQQLELAERSFGGKSWPDLTLISSQREEDGVLRESAELQFTVKTEEDPRVAEGLVKRLRFESEGLLQLAQGRWRPLEKTDPLWPFGQAVALERIKDFWKEQVIFPVQVKPLPLLASHIVMELPNLRGSNQEKVLLASTYSGGMYATNAAAKSSLGKFSATLSAEEARFVEKLLLSDVGLTCRVSGILFMDYTEWVGKTEKDAKPVLDMNPLGLVNDWLDLAATRPGLTAAEHQLVQEIARQHAWAVQQGYQAKDVREEQGWARLAKANLDKKAKRDQIENNHFATVELAAKYLLWICDPQNSGKAGTATGNLHRRETTRAALVRAATHRPGFLNFLGHFPVKNAGLASRHGTNKPGGFATPLEQEKALSTFEGSKQLATWTSQGKYWTVDQDGFVRLEASPEVRRRLIQTTQDNKPGLLVLDTGDDPTLGLGATAIEIRPRLEFATATAAQKQFASQLKERLAKAGNPVGDYFHPLGVRSDANKTTIEFTPVRWTKAGGWQKQQAAKWLPLSGPALQFVLGDSAKFADELSKQNLLEARFFLDHTVPHPSDLHTMTSLKNAGGFVDKKAEPIAFTVDLPVFKGSRLVPSLAKNLDVLRIDGRQLDWQQLNPKATLRSIEVKLRQANRLVSMTLEPQKTPDGPMVLPEVIQWLIRPDFAEQGPIYPEIIFVHADGARHAWRFNGQPEEFLKNYPTLEVALLPSDVEQAVRIGKK